MAATTNQTNPSAICLRSHSLSVSQDALLKSPITSKRITAPMTALIIAATTADKNKPNPRQEPAGDDGADNADRDVAHEAKAIALDDEAREPAGNRANHQPNDKSLNCHDHPPHMSWIPTQARR